MTSLGNITFDPATTVGICSTGRSSVPSVAQGGYVPEKVLKKMSFAAPDAKPKKIKATKKSLSHHRVERSDQAKAEIRANLAASKGAFRKKLFAMTHPKANGTLCVFPKGVDKKTATKRMRDFIKGKEFDHFYAKLSKVLVEITQTDVESMRTGTPTAAAVEFLSCMDILNENGFYNVNGRAVSFWSGNEARLLTNKSSFMTDSKVPAVNFIMTLWWACIMPEEQRLGQNHLTSLLAEALCTAYALQARGEVHVFMSADKASEMPGFQWGNIFTNAELPTLRRLKKEGLVTAIIVHHLKPNSNKWTQGREIDSPEGSGMMTTRRVAHQSGARAGAGGGASIDDTNPDRFVKSRDFPAFKKWCREEEARPMISKGRMQAVARKFRLNVQKQKIVRNLEMRLKNPDPAVKNTVRRTVLAQNATAALE